MKRITIILIFIIAIIAAGSGLYYIQTQNSTEQNDINRSLITKDQIDELSAIKEPEPVEIIETDEEIAVPETDGEQIIIDGWQVYRDEDFGFQISYPQDWVYEKWDDRIAFGTPKSKIGGYMWVISIYEPDELETAIAGMGDQFSDRKESRSEVTVNENIIGLVVTVTTNEYDNWLYKRIYFENNGRLFAIGNGAVDDNRFKSFYGSFEFVD